MNIDSIGPETIDDFYNRGLIRNVADLYELKAGDINGDGRREKTATNILTGIENSKQVPYERVIFALGIRFVGVTSAKLLASKFNNIDRLASASADELMSVDGIGEVIARSVIDYFANEDNKQIINRLRIYGLQMERSAEEEAAKSNILEGKSIVISGVFEHHSRDEYKSLIEQNGGKNVGSISGKTSFILAGANMGPSKLEKAQNLGVKIMSEDEFLSIIEKG